jgi:hypothetical protein
MFLLHFPLVLFSEGHVSFIFRVKNNASLLSSLVFLDWGSLALRVDIATYRWAERMQFCSGGCGAAGYSVV